MIYWQVHTILSFLPTINTQINMTEIMQTKVLQEAWHLEIRSTEPHAAEPDKRETVFQFSHEEEKEKAPSQVRLYCPDKRRFWTQTVWQFMGKKGKEEIWSFKYFLHM